MAANVMKAQNFAVEDSTFYIVDQTDSTKVVQFQCSGITTGTTRTITIPDSDATIGSASAIAADDITAGDAAINITTSLGDIILETTSGTGSIILKTDTDTTDSDVLITNNSDATLLGITGDGAFDINSSTFDLDASGVLTLNSAAISGNSNLTHAGGAGSDLDIDCTLGSLNLSAGEADAAAVRINASNAAGGIDIDAGSAGITIDTTGGISIDATSAASASNIIHTGATGVDFTVECTDGSMILSSNEAVSDAVRIHARNAAGGIDVDAGTGGINVAAASGDITLTTSTAGDVNIQPAGFTRIGNQYFQDFTGTSVTTVSSKTSIITVPSQDAQFHIVIEAVKTGTSGEGYIKVVNLVSQATGATPAAMESFTKQTTSHGIVSGSDVTFTYGGAGPYTITVSLDEGTEDATWSGTMTVLTGGTITSIGSFS